MGAIAASLGEKEVGVFSASYRILWITLIFVGALSDASGIKIAQRLGSGNVVGARQAAIVGISLAFGILLILSLIVYCNIRLCGSLFTNDESYLNLFEECRLPFTCVLFVMNFAVAIETIPDVYVIYLLEGALDIDQSISAETGIKRLSFFRIDCMIDTCCSCSFIRRMCSSD